MTFYKIKALPVSMNHMHIIDFVQSILHGQERKHPPVSMRKIIATQVISGGDS